MACGQGTATRNGSCAFMGGLVPDSFCSHMPLPPTEQACYLEPCAAVSWAFTAWGTCTGGVESRNISCLEPDGSVVANQVLSPQAALACRR